MANVFCHVWSQSQFHRHIEFSCFLSQWSWHLVCAVSPAYFKESDNVVFSCDRQACVVEATDLIVSLCCPEYCSELWFKTARWICWWMAKVNGRCAWIGVLYHQPMDDYNVKQKGFPLTRQTLDSPLQWHGYKVHFVGKKILHSICRSEYLT